MFFHESNFDFISSKRHIPQFLILASAARHKALELEPPDFNLTKSDTLTTLA
jgi:hypothetical protein